MNVYCLKLRMRTQFRNCELWPCALIRICTIWMKFIIILCQSFQPWVMSKFELSYERRVLPYLLQPPASSGGEFWLTGSDGSCTVHPDLVASLFTVVQTTSSLIVPDAPVFALKQLAQLLHTGRFMVWNIICSIYHAIHRTSEGISEEIKEWVLHLVRNLNGTSAITWCSNIDVDSRRTDFSSSQESIASAKYDISYLDFLSMRRLKATSIWSAANFFSLLWAQHLPVT